MALTLQIACMPPVNGAAALLMKRTVQPIFMLRETPSSSKGRQASILAAADGKALACDPEAA